MPPFALISSMAITAPSRKFVPDTAPAPDSSITIGMFTVCCACTAAAPNASAAAVNTTAVFMVYSSLELLRFLGLLRLGADVVFHESTLLGGDCRQDSEPLLEAVAGLLEQHAQPVDRPVPALACLREQLGLEWDVHHIINHR